jgi:hypothetical protein
MISRLSDSHARGEALKIAEMRHRSSTPEQIAATTQRRLAGLAGSPLQPVYELMREKIEAALDATREGYASGDELQLLCRYFEHVLKRLPRTFGERFYFDAGLIRAISQDFGTEVVLPNIVVPHYGAGWGHERIIMPSEDRERAHVIHLIHFPGKDALDEVDLVEYPWVFHELLHCIFSRDDSEFSVPFEQRVARVGRSTRLASIADRGSARQKSRTRVEELIRYWSPGPPRGDWSRELALDTISAWICGPAYFAALLSVVAEGRVNPYKITQNHPPYALRTRALAAVAAELHFNESRDKLLDLERGWRRSHWDRMRDNRFLSLANPELISGCVETAITFCRDNKLRKCSPEILTKIRNALANNGDRSNPDDEIGVDLILSAWCINSDLGETVCNEWTRERVRLLSRLLMPSLQ